MLTKLGHAEQHLVPHVRISSLLYLQQSAQLLLTPSRACVGLVGNSPHTRLSVQGQVNSSMSMLEQHLYNANGKTRGV